MELTVRKLHEKAMLSAELGIVTKHKNKTFQSRMHFERAMGYERRAAALVPLAPESEPTRGILYRSAAWLAMDCGYAAEAKGLAEEGLRGTPPPQIADELRDVLDAAQKALERAP